MIKLKRTNSEDSSFVDLVILLDQELKILDGREHDFYAQYNKVDHINHVVVAFDNNAPVGCGAIKRFYDKTCEIKRMFVVNDCRGKGIASLILKELEGWASELQFTKCILETGVKQPEAIGMYKKNGYKRISNYGQYENAENSKCFEKELK